MHTDPDRDRPSCSIVALGRQLQDAESARDRRTRRAEDDIEAVALGLDLCPVELGDRLAYQTAIRAEQGRRGVVAVGLDPRRIVAQVGEQKATSDTGRLDVRDGVAPLGGSARSVQPSVSGTRIGSCSPERRFAIWRLAVEPGRG